MARIRSIKPEFFSSPGVETLDPWARLLFVGMWCWADDNGVGVANPRELLGFAFPLDEEVTLVDLRRMLVGIRRVFGVKFYVAAGRSYYAIPTWEKHQKFDRRSKGKYPTPDEADSALDLGEGQGSAETHEYPSSVQRDSVAGTGEQGNRGTGEEETSSPAAPSMPTPPGFDAFWDEYPRRVGKQAAIKAWMKAVKRTTPSAILGGALRLAQDPNREDQFTPHPATWLNEGRWEDDPLPDRTQTARTRPSTTDAGIAAIQAMKHPHRLEIA